jgi:hypothetical protein
MTSRLLLRPAVHPPCRASGPPALCAAVVVLAACLPAAAAAGQAPRGVEVPDGPIVVVGRLDAAGFLSTLPADTCPTNFTAISGPSAAEADPTTDAGAQASPSRAIRPREAMVRVRAAGTVGLISFAAADTFKALYGSSTGLTLGGAVQFVHRQGWFAQVDISHYRATGERVFVSGTDRFRLGIASRVTVTPVEVTAGYRLARRPQAPRPPPAVPPGRRAARPRRPSRFASLVPYGGAGIGAVRLTERADFAEAGDDVDEFHRSYHIVGGVELPVRNWLAAGVDAGYRWVPGALGSGGVSKEFGETDLGGFVVRVRAIVGR